MRNVHAWMILLPLTGMLTSCGSAPTVRVTEEGDIGQAVKCRKVVIVSDAGKYTGDMYTEQFLYHMTRLTQDCDKQVSVMTVGEFVNSPYARPEMKDAFTDRVFVLVNTMGKEEGEYGTYSLKCLMEIKCLDGQALFTQEITVPIGNDFMEASWARADQFAKTIYDTLKSRNIL